MLKMLIFWDGGSTRYLIVIDDVRKDEVWAEIEGAFPKESSSRIIVTTSVQSVAKKCSLGGFMYRLEGLNEVDSDKLLWQLVGCDRNELPQDVQSHSVDIVRKCDGLPLALTGVAEYVRLKLEDLRRGELRCSAIVRDLGNNLAGRLHNAAFKAAHATLKECYEGLYSHDLKTCLLSVSMFPKNYSIRRKSLVRRWMAEQLVPVPFDGQEHASTVADKNFEKLVDRIMIQRADDEEDPAPAVVPGAVKNKCRVQGVLLDFLHNKSVSSKFARLIQNGEHLQTTSGDNNLGPRRLAIVYDPKANRAGGGNSNKAKLAEMVEGLDLSHVRSLTAAGTELSDFKLKRCKVLRVLDLDGCTGITGGVLRRICKLKVLRYLSLRGTTIDACGLPAEIAEMRFLETLDVRDIVIVVRGSKSKAEEDHVATITLPCNVLCLPYLKYLFGAFELPRDIAGPARGGLALWPKAARASGGAAAQACKLHTLAGIFIGGGDREGHQRLQNLFGLMHQDRLKKIKIWWNKKGVKGSKPKPTTAHTDLLVKFLENRCFTLESLSLDFGDESLDFLDFAPVNAHLPCKIESVKLRGKLSKLPAFITANEHTMLDHALSKLYLSYTGLSCEALLLLQCLPNLKYLKLIEDNSNFTDGTLTLNDARGFRSLRGLHVQAPKLPKVIIVVSGKDKTVAMKHLTTLQLLCKDISGFQAAHIDYFHRLEQVVLLKSSLDINEKTAMEWEEARKKHMNRPRIDTIECRGQDQ
jgi:disease resistance protein RPM1